MLRMCGTGSFRSGDIDLHFCYWCVLRRCCYVLGNIVEYVFISRSFRVIKSYLVSKGVSFTLTIEKPEADLTTDLLTRYFIQSYMLACCFLFVVITMY